jgi:hypothetical protein
MKRRTKYVILAVALAGVWGLELLADFRVPGVWWSHSEAMGYSGLAFVALAVWLFVFVRE